jgi:DNA helicase MCM8
VYFFFFIFFVAQAISYDMFHLRLSLEAASVLQSFYLELRSKHKSVDGTPITTRQLESLIRLSEARAKVELRTEVTERDAKVCFVFNFPALVQCM